MIDKLGDQIPKDPTARLLQLEQENWQLRGALGYPVPGDIPEGGFKCGLCEAKEKELIELRAVCSALIHILKRG